MQPRSLHHNVDSADNVVYILLHKLAKTATDEPIGIYCCLFKNAIASIPAVHPVPTAVAICILISE